MVIEKEHERTIWLRIAFFLNGYGDKETLRAKKGLNIKKVAWRVTLFGTEVCGMGTLVIEKKSNNNKHHAINIRHK